MRKNLSLIITSLVLALVVIWPIRQTGIWYPMHDSTSVTRVLLMKTAIMNGQIPPIWAENINGGFGYPLFHFYAPLFHTISTLFSFFITPVTSAIKLTIFLSIFTGILGSVYFAKRWGRLAALVTGVAFALAPYAAVNIYVRGAFAEYLSLALLPWVLIVTEKITSTRKMVVAGVFLSLFVLSHNLIPIIALPMVLVWMITQNKLNLKLVVGAIILSALLSAWFVLPLVMERGFTQADTIAKTTNYAKHFVEPWQLWNSTWGFGGSAQGVEDGMSFKLGKIQLILGMLGALIAFREKKKSLKLISLFILISVFLTTSASKFVWDRLPTLQIVQFPWRNLGIITVFLSLLSGFTVSRINHRVFRFVGASLIMVMLFLTGYKYFVPESTNIAKDEVSDIASVVPEYVPTWWKIPPAQRYDFYAPPSISSAENETSQQGPAAGGYHFDLVATDPSIIIFGSAYYPTWEGRVDGKKVAVSPNGNGLASFTIPQGIHSIDLRQSHTQLEKFAAIISLITLAIMIKLYVKA
ncbi:MAG: 6-pyruvoyl-tetrahydropterin synthase-related protein [bacterium]